MRCLAAFAVKFMIALPNHTAVFAGGVPDFRSEVTATAGADDSCGKYITAAVGSADLLSPYHFRLHYVKFLWVNDRRMAVFYECQQAKRQPQSKM